MVESRKEIIKRLYESGMSTVDISRELGITTPAVSYNLKSMNVKIRDQHRDDLRKKNINIDGSVLVWNMNCKYDHHVFLCVVSS